MLKLEYQVLLGSASIRVEAGSADRVSNYLSLDLRLLSHTGHLTTELEDEVVTALTVRKSLSVDVRKGDENKFEACFDARSGTNGVELGYPSLETVMSEKTINRLLWMMHLSKCEGVKVKLNLTMSTNSLHAIAKAATGGVLSYRHAFGAWDIALSAQ